MEEIYKKIINGELNINYLSPMDLMNLEMFLEQIHISLSDLLKYGQIKNAKLEQKKSQLQTEILKCILEDEVI